MVPVNHLKVWLLVVGLLSSVEAVAESGAVALLYGQAAYWDRQNRGDLARNALNRILQSDARNAKARYLLGLSYVKENDLTAAGVVLRELHGVSDSGDPDSNTYAEALAIEIKNSSFDERKVAKARKLAASGEHKAAVAVYSALFEGREPAGPLAIEMCYAMSGDEALRPEALSRLKQMVISRPNDVQARLALARVMTYSEDTRRQGLDGLLALQADPAINEDVDQDIRNALLWLHAGPNDLVHFEQYLREYPDDQALRKKHSLLLTRVDPSTAEGQVIIGYRYLNQEKLAAAEAAFKQALTLSSGDAASKQRQSKADASAGLSILRHRSGQHRVALTLLDEAAKVDAGAAKRYADLRRSVAFWAELERANALVEEGDFNAALTVLESLYATGDSQKLERLLLQASAQKGAVNPGQAEKTLREAIQIDPVNERARLALLDLYLDQRNLTGLAAAVRDHDRLRATSGASNTLEAKVYRARAILAAQQKDQQSAQDYFQTGIQYDKDDVWIRLDYARFLAATNGAQEGMMEAERIPVSGDDRNEGLFAKALYFNEHQQWDRVVDYLQAVDHQYHTTDTQRILKQALFRQHLETLVEMGELRGGTSVEDDLIRLYETEISIPDRAVYVVDALQTLDLDASALAIVRQSLDRRSSELSPQSQLILIQHLIGWGSTDSARIYLSRLEQTRNLSARTERDITAVRLQLEQHYALQSIQTKKYRKAESYLASATLIDPANTTTLRLRGQLAREEGKLDQSVRFYQQAIESDQQDMWAIKGAVGSAIELGDLKTARTIVQTALVEFPENPDIYELIFNIAQAANDAELAIKAMAHSRQLRRKQ